MLQLTASNAFDRWYSAIFLSSVLWGLLKARLQRTAIRAKDEI
jgi:hypothetical protein